MEQKENLGTTVEGGSTVPVQEEIEDTYSVSSDNLSPDLGEVWQYGGPLSPVWNSECDSSATSSTFSSEESFEYHEHNIWNPMLAFLCHFEIGVRLEALLDEIDMGRIALACHFSMDLLCYKTSSLPVINDHLPVRNWPLPSSVNAATESNVTSPTAEHEPAKMQYTLDGSPWSFISPFLDLHDTFNMRTAVTTWNSAAKYLCGALLFSCCIMNLGIGLADMHRRTVEFGGYRNVLRRH